MNRSREELQLEDAMKIGVVFFGSQKFCLKDCEYMFGKIFKNFATFWERKNLKCLQGCV